jgi:hypothetical protein
MLFPLTNIECNALIQICSNKPFAKTTLELFWDRVVQYFIEICRLFIKICRIVLCGLAHIRNLPIFDSRLSPKICGFAFGGLKNMFSGPPQKNILWIIEEKQACMYIQKSAHIYASPQLKSWQFGPLKQKVLGTYENRKGTEMRHDGVCSVWTTTLWREPSGVKSMSIVSQFPLLFTHCRQRANNQPDFTLPRNRSIHCIHTRQTIGRFHGAGDSQLAVAI